MLFLVFYGAPAVIKSFSLPSACPTYSNVDASGISLTMLNVTNGAVEYNPAVPAPYDTYSSKKARCWKGPCIDLCCNTNSNGTCVDNLISQGGHYNPGTAFTFLQQLIQ